MAPRVKRVARGNAEAYLAVAEDGWPPPPLEAGAGVSDSESPPPLHVPALGKPPEELQVSAWSYGAKEEHG